MQLLQSIGLILAMVFSLSCEEPIVVEPRSSNFFVDTKGFSHWRTHMNAIVKWKVSDSLLQAEINCPTRGWAAIGFNSLQQMVGANVIIGYFNGSDHFQDSIAVGSPKGLVPDTALIPAGTDDIIDATITENDQGTVLSFRFPLVTNNNNGDVSLELGEKYYILAACSDSDDFSTNHMQQRAMLGITLQTQPPPVTN